MSEFLNLSEAVSRLVKSGDRVALEGFTHLIPFAAGHEIIRQRRSTASRRRWRDPTPGLPPQEKMSLLAHPLPIIWS